jgi:hypothetical protein
VGYGRRSQRAAAAGVCAEVTRHTRLPTSSATVARRRIGHDGRAPYVPPMMLTPLPLDAVPSALDRFASGLAGDTTAMAVLARIAATCRGADADGPADTPERRAAAVALARALGIPTLDEEPAVSFSWDGRVLRTQSEPWVILHEIAHWLICPPQRRGLPDFGVGAGPESGRKAEADRARVVDDESQQRDEAMASLLGVLLEAELGQPAILAFLEQNWLEGYERESAALHFRATVAALARRGLIDAAGRPTCRFPGTGGSVAFSRARG